MPLSPIDEPGEVDAFGVRFTMKVRGERVRCHVFRSAICLVEDRLARGGDDLLAMFQKNRSLFELLAEKLHDAGHRTPWIEPFAIAGEAE